MTAVENRMKMPATMLLVFCLLFPACGGTKPRVHPDLDKRDARIAHVAVMEPSVEIVRHTDAGTVEDPTLDAERIAFDVVMLVSDQLERRGMPLAEPDGEDEVDDIDAALARLRTAFEQAAEKVVPDGRVPTAAERLTDKRTLPSEKKRRHDLDESTGLGEIAGIVGRHYDADALVFIDISGTSTTTTRKINDTAAGSMVAGVIGLAASLAKGTVETELVILLVESASGEILWAHRSSTKRKPDALGLEQAVEQAFADFPSVDESGRLRQ